MPRQHRRMPPDDSAANVVVRDRLSDMLRGWLSAVLLWVGLAAAFFLPPNSDGAHAQTASSQTDSAIFEKIASVLRHPRCLNCHQVEVPLQGDRGWQHIP